MSKKDKKVTIVDKDGSASKIKMGEAYDLAQAEMRITEPLTAWVLEDKYKEIQKWVRPGYYMLLSKKISNYTIFNVSTSLVASSKFIDWLKICFKNRGKVTFLDLDDSQNAWDIWITDSEGEAHFYKLFNFDYGVCEC